MYPSNPRREQTLPLSIFGLYCFVLRPSHLTELRVFRSPCGSRTTLALFVFAPHHSLYIPRLRYARSSSLDLSAKGRSQGENPLTPSQTRHNAMAEKSQIKKDAPARLLLFVLFRLLIVVLRALIPWRVQRYIHYPAHNGQAKTVQRQFSFVILKSMIRIVVYLPILMSISRSPIVSRL